MEPLTRAWWWWGRCWCWLAFASLPQADGIWRFHADAGSQGWTYGLGNSAVHFLPDTQSYVSMATVWTLGGSAGSGFMTRYLPKQRTAWNRGPACYFDGNSSQLVPSWFRRFLTDNTTSLEQVVVWAPDLRPAWELYYSAFNMETNKACIGRAFSNASTQTFEQHGPLDWEDAGEPLLCSHGRERNVYREDDTTVDDGGNITMTARRVHEWANEVNDTFYRIGNGSTLYGPSDALEPAVFSGDNNSLWMVYGSAHLSSGAGQRGIFLVQLNPRTGLLYENVSEPPWNTPGQFPVVPQRLFGGRENKSVSSPFVFRYHRRDVDTNQSWYFLFYAEKYRTSDAYFLTQDGVSPPNPVANFTHSIRVVRAESPTGPWFDRDGNKAGSYDGGTLIMNSTLAKTLRLTNMQSMGIRSRYIWNRGGYPQYWDRHNGPVRKSSLGYTPFCGVAHPAVEQYENDADGHDQFVLSFTYYQCDDPASLAVPYFASLELTFGNVNTTFQKPWPEVGGAWNPYVITHTTPEPFPYLLVLIPALCLLGGSMAYKALQAHVKHMKQSRVSPGTVIDRERPWWAIFVDPWIMCVNSLAYKLCGRIAVVTMDHTDALIEKYSDALGEVLQVFDAYQIDSAQRLRWLQKWQSMDTDGSNGLDLDEFCAFFKLPKDRWSMRIFELFSRNFNGQISFRDFLEGAYSFLVYDRTVTYSFAFRLLSRRGSSFDSNFDVLDKVDLVQFLESRYPHDTPMNTNRKAAQIYDFIDDDGVGGINYHEFQRFCRQNFTFLLWGHRLQEIMRQGLFGTKYWKSQTAARQDIYVFDKVFIVDLNSRLEKDVAPYLFSTDFSVVYEQQQVKRTDRLARQKERLDVAYRSNAREYSSLKHAVEKISASCGGLSVRFAFYHWSRMLRDADRAAASVSISEQDSLKKELGADPGDDIIKFALHSRILAEQRRAVPTADEAMATFEASLFQALHPAVDRRPTTATRLKTANIDAGDWGQPPFALSATTFAGSSEEMDTLPMHLLDDVVPSRLGFVDPAEDEASARNIATPLGEPQRFVE